MKRVSTFFIISFLFILSCEDDKDTTPPKVNITSPSNGSKVNEVVNVTCMSTDNKEVSKVELWVDGVNTGLTDDTEPYSFKWNTNTYKDGDHTLIVRGYDTSDNEGDSPPITVKIDNTISVPNSVLIDSLNFSNDIVTIYWSKSSDGDFKSYTIEHSVESQMNDYENIFTTEDINIISTIKDNMSPLTYHYFRVTVTDTFDYQTKGPIYTSLLETYPTPSQINSIKYSYEKESFEIYWTKNTDNDFKSYYINESENEDMSNEKEITQINDQNIEYFEVSNDPGLTRYYQLIVEDNYGLKSNSDIKIGKSFEIFTQTFGGVSSDPDYGMYGHQTSDGGYIITGRVRNNNIYHDMLLIKTNSKGTKEWDYTHGSPGKEDSGVFTKQTIDGGYILLGETESEGNGKLDYSLIKVTSLGNHDWRNLFGGVDYDKPFSLDETTDGGFIIVGSTRSFGNGTIDGNDKDLWLIKTSSSGSEEWKKTFGTQNMDFDDEGVSVQQTTDGGYIITGHTRQSYDPEQIWLLKTDSNGNEEWNKTFGDDSEAEFGKSVKQTIDGGYIILGYTSGGGSFGDNDIWLIKTDSQGNQEWLREFGDGKDDTGFSIDITTDGGYIIVGHTYYRNSYDIWLIKTDSQGTEQWNKKFGGPGNDFGRSVQQTSDGGYFITGTVDSGNHDIWIIKTDPEGNIE